MLFLFYKAIKCSERQLLKQSFCFSHRNHRSHWHLFVAVPQAIDVSFLHLMDIKNMMIRAVLSSSGDASATHSIQIFVGEAQGGRVKKELPQTSSFPFPILTINKPYVHLFVYSALHLCRATSAWIQPAGEAQGSAEKQNGGGLSTHWGDVHESQCGLNVGAFFPSVWDCLYVCARMWTTGGWSNLWLL